MYSEEFIGPAIAAKSNAFLTPYAVSTSNADIGSWAVMEQIQITRIMFFVTTLVASSTANAVITFYARPTSGSSSSQVSIGTLTIPTGSTVGSVIYKNVESIKIPPGYDICAAGTTAATDGSSVAGAGLLGFKAFVNAEDPRNISKMVASA